MSRCNNQAFSIVSLQYYNGSTTITRPYKYNSTAGSLTIKYDEVNFSPDSFIGSQTLTITGSTEGGAVTVSRPMRIVMNPPE